MALADFLRDHAGRADRLRLSARAAWDVSRPARYKLARFTHGLLRLAAFGGVVAFGCLLGLWTSITEDSDFGG